MCVDGKKKADFVRALHEKVQMNIEQRNAKVAQQADKGRVKVLFELGDWILVHFRK